MPLDELELGYVDLALHDDAAIVGLPVKCLSRAPLYLHRLFQSVQGGLFATCMPRRFVDYLPGSAIPLAHMPKKHLGLIYILMSTPFEHSDDDMPTLEGHFDLATWYAIEAPDFKWSTSTNLIRQRAVERLLFWTDLPPLPPLPLHLDKPRTSADP
ncbi:hypothetical protein M405DRAFT_931982 [Rhizopogon salebrosus TDB-379]|nr:hypothetical protein M405DRAFT_931982 [Rhizopogon salebrosus TDB-379]